MSNSHTVLHVNKGKIPHKKYGDIEDVSYQLVCISPIGSYKQPSKEDLEEQVQYLTKWESEIQFPETKHAQKYERLAQSGGAGSLYGAPNLPPKSDKIRASGKLATWILLMDDLLDELKAEQPLTTTYEALSKDFDVFTKILDGEINGKTDAPEPSSTLTHFKTVCAILQDIQENLSQAAPAFGKKENRKYFIKAVNDFLHGLLWNFDRSDSDHASEFVFVTFRSYYVSSYIVFETLALLNDIDWEESKIDRESLEFRCWRNTFANAFAFTNDLLSLRKEIGEGEKENLVIHRHLNSGLSINGAVRQVVQVVNSELHDVKVYGDRLLARSPESLGLKKLAEMTYWILDGHLKWYGYNKRHGGMDVEERQMEEHERHNIVHGHKRKHDHHKAAQDSN